MFHVFLLMLQGNSLYSQIRVALQIKTDLIIPYCFAAFYTINHNVQNYCTKFNNIRSKYRIEV